MWMTSHGQCPRGVLVNVQEWGYFSIFWGADDVTRTMSKGGCLWMSSLGPPLSGNPVSAPVFHPSKFRPPPPPTTTTWMAGYRPAVDASKLPIVTQKPTCSTRHRTLTFLRPSYALWGWPGTWVLLGTSNPPALLYPREVHLDGVRMQHHFSSMNGNPLFYIEEPPMSSALSLMKLSRSLLQDWPDPISSFHQK